MYLYNLNVLRFNWRATKHTWTNSRKHYTIKKNQSQLHHVCRHIYNTTQSVLYSGRFPQVGAKFLSTKNTFLPPSLLKLLSGTNPTCKTVPFVSKTPANSPNCAYITQFPLKKVNWTQKNPSSIVSILEGFDGGSRRIRIIDLPGMNTQFVYRILEKRQM